MMKAAATVALIALVGGADALRSRKAAAEPAFKRVNMSLKSTGEPAQATRDVAATKRWDTPMVSVVHLQTADQTASEVCGVDMLPFFPPGDSRYGCETTWPEITGCATATETESAPTTRGGVIAFSNEAEIRKVGQDQSQDSWTNWGHGYTSTAYYFNDNTSLWRLPPGHGSFSFFVIPNQQDEFSFEVGTWDGSVFETSLTEPIDGNMSAEGFAICSTGEIEYVRVNFDGPAGFAAGEFNIGMVAPQIYVGGDPHVVGYHGEKFDFKGEVGKVFNLLTDSDIQLNALFDRSCTRRKATIIKEIGLATAAGDSEITIRNNGVYVDGIALMAGKHELAEGVTALVHDSELVDVQITMPRYTVAVDSAVNRCGDAHLQVRVHVLDEEARPHGLMGQTKYSLKERSVLVTREPSAGYSHHNGEGQLEGYSQDYMVGSLFGSNFAYNRFNRA
eukprot:NODE_110_length_1511_cov_17.622435_g81_i0.p2 GENE.NODE_110_length_1511_cov_17.622435_g81_i0~~NODE_110_length_1511_cov_17.622435_g81_i0.p2  ORF type:complete len:448 (-),score=135.25 NODE_110_length_1511_cov_17.622435_g81_i0:125-1468(-)